MSKKLIRQLFGYAQSIGANDLVIESAAEKLLLNYYFADGRDHSFSLPKKLEKNLLANLRQLLEIAPGELTAKKYCRLKDGNFQSTFYLTILPNKNSEKIIINLINRPLKLWRLSQLGLQAPALKTIKNILKKPRGLILVSAPGLEGKSATAHALIQELDPSALNIYVLKNQAAPEIAGINYLDLSKTNREALLRHDSDVIMLDEIIDEETLAWAVRTAASGRLVIGTLKANNSWEVLTKIMALSLPLKLKLDSLKIIINQRIVRLKKKPNAKQKNKRSEIGVFEILEPNDKMIKSAGSDFKPLAHDLKKKLKEGLI